MTEAAARLAQHAVVLRSGQAPHQQSLAQDIEDVLAIVKDPAAQIDAAMSLLAGKDRNLMELTAQQGRNEEAIRRVSNEREALRGAMNDAVAAKDEAVRHRDEAQKERDAAVAQVKTLSGQCADFSRQIEELIARTGDRDKLEVRVVELEGKLAAAEKELEGKAGLGIATTAGETMADIKKGQKTKA